jgi:hypothetical protein
VLLNSSLASVTNGPEKIALFSSWGLSGTPAILIVLNHSLISLSSPSHS